MLLPQTLRDAIEQETAAVGAADLARAGRELTAAYRAGSPPKVMTTPAQRAAYLQLRMPATYAANARVFQEIGARLGGAPVRSLLDLGAGPGTAMWAAAEVFPVLERITVVERDARLAATGQRMAQFSTHPAIRAAGWAREDVAADLPFPPHDLVVLSYVLGELEERQRTRVIAQALRLAAVALVVVEPGTPRGFAHVLQAREQVIGARAALIAPCPHEVTCPMAAAGDWCHFAQRLERTAVHRRSKGGTLAYEDEKFSYVVAGPAVTQRRQARIVRHPLKHGGHVQLTLCTAQGLQRRTVTRSEGALYRAARQAEWGDEWNELE